ncbi:MAG TPA: hypothetical protein VN516_09455 [Candidatus Baltobacteraceae bacterium]|nr:hypothetical protein [Candidatus Baltobacteraceae bacterium]
MLIGKQITPKAMAEDATQTVVSKLLIPAGTLTNVGDVLIAEYIGTATMSGIFILRAKMDGNLQGGDDGMIAEYDTNSGDNQSVLIRVALMLLGTGKVAGMFWYQESDDGGGQIKSIVGEANILTGQDGYIILTVEGDTGTPTSCFTLTSSTLRVFKNSNGQPDIGTVGLYYDENFAHNPPWHIHWSDDTNYSDVEQTSNNGVQYRPIPAKFVAQYSEDGGVTWEEGEELTLGTLPNPVHFHVTFDPSPFPDATHVRVIGRNASDEDVSFVSQAWPISN